MSRPFVRRPSPRRGRHAATTLGRHTGFAARLLLSVALTLVLVGAVQYRTFSAQIESTFLRAGVTTARADARMVEAAYAGAEGMEPLAAVAEVIAYIAARDDVNGVYLIDGSGMVVAAHDRSVIGRLEPHSVARVARSGGVAGPESEVDEAGEGENFEHLQPVRLGGALHVLEVDVDGVALQAPIRAGRRRTMLLMLAGLLAAVPLFYLLGGRTLFRLHRAAVNRAMSDGLTDLGNQTAFQEAVRRAAAASDAQPLTVALIDVDDFKVVNDRHGHRAGDGVLEGVARLLASGRQADRAFRVGGDEFALILPRTSTAAAARRLERMRVDAAGRLGGATVSCGVATVDPAAPDADTTIEQADAALYEAKRRGRDRVVRFEELDETLVITAARIRAVHALLDGAPVQVAFQPIWELGEASRRLVGFEALARPEVTDLRDAGEAFEVAERIGRAHELDRLCRRATLARAHELPPGALLFLNVSPQSLDHDELAGDALARAVVAAGLTPERVVLEITERSTARVDRVVREASRLRALGFKLALDDVGAGNAGLEMLRTLPVDFVKIDRQVVADSCRGGSARAVLHAVVSFAAEVGAFVIAEGIEDEEMLAHVRRPPRRTTAARGAGVHGAQGYLLGRPSVSLTTRRDAA